jgi:hypothetical protein
MLLSLMNHRIACQVLGKRQVRFFRLHMRSRPRQGGVLLPVPVSHPDNYVGGYGAGRGKVIHPLGALIHAGSGSAGKKRRILVGKADRNAKKGPSRTCKLWERDR